MVERRAELLLDQAEGEARSFRLPEGSTYLGSGQDAAIRLEDETLEARHLELDWDGTELWLIFLGQGERPQVNGKLVSEAQLKSGDQLEVAGRTLRVRILRRTRPATEAEIQAGLATGPEPEAPVAPPAPPEPPPPPEARPEDQVLLEYSVHLLRDQPKRGLVVALGMMVFLVLMGLWATPGNPAMLLVGLAILVGSVGAFLFPLRYRLTEAGVEIRGFPVRDNKRWRRFASYVEYPDAVQLLVPQRDFRGRVIKGSLVYFGPHRERVMEIVRSKVPKGGPPVPDRRGGRRGRKAGGATGHPN